jgi:hypothetical protein
MNHCFKARRIAAWAAQEKKRGQLAYLKEPNEPET